MVLNLVGVPVWAESDAVSLDELLKRVELGRVDDARENEKRIKKFDEDKVQQASLLESIKIELTAEEERSKALEQEFESNENILVESRETLKQRLGDLNELFGVLQQVAGDTRSGFEYSLTNIQHPERDKFLTKFIEKVGSDTQLASLDEIEQFWFELQREMTESGKVVTFPALVTAVNGDKKERSVTRIGVFNVVAQGKYLEFEPKTQRLVELARQPQDRFLKMVNDLESKQTGLTAFGLDPARGQILSLLVQTPNLRERIEQGGVIGYIILGLGAVAFIVIIIRLVLLMLTGINIRLQMRQPDKPVAGNPLGRILKIYHSNPDIDLESLELKLGEAILKETPKLERWNILIKIIAVVAPLLGLLGTVTGMIITFQSITLFGTGDPKLMAGGISQALVTTVLGLSVAIPTVLLHTLVNSRSKRLQEILEQQAAGMIANSVEKRQQSISS